MTLKTNDASNPHKPEFFRQALHIFAQAGEAFVNCQFHTSLTLFEKAHLQFNRLPDEESQRNVGRCLGNIGLIHYQLGNYDQAREYHHRSLKISVKFSDFKSQAEDWGNLGLSAYKMSDFPEAILCFEKAVKLYSVLENVSGVNRQFGNLGIVYFLMGHYEQARKYFLYALPTVAPHEKGDFYSHLGAIQMGLSDYHGAEEYFRKAVELAREFEDRESEANALGNIGLIYQQLDQFEKSERCHKQALEISREILDKNGEAQDLGHLGTLYQEIGDFQQAASYHQEALEIARSLGSRDIESSSLLNLGLTFYAVGNTSGSLDTLSQALSFARDGLKIAELIEARENIIIGNFLMGAILEFFEQEDTYRAAYICYAKAIENLEKTRAEIIPEQSRIGFVANKINLYERIVHVAIKLEHPKDAYQYAERGKSRAFLELLNQTYPSIAHEIDIKSIQDELLKNTDFDTKTHDNSPFAYFFRSF